MWKKYRKVTEKKFVLNIRKKRIWHFSQEHHLQFWEYWWGIYTILRFKNSPEETRLKFSFKMGQNRIRYFPSTNLQFWERNQIILLRNQIWNSQLATGNLQLATPQLTFFPHPLFSPLATGNWQLATCNSQLHNSHYFHTPCFHH